MNYQQWSISTFALALLGIGASTGAFAQSRCDCDVIVDRCRAEVTEVPTKSVGSRFLIKADTQHCAIVEWTIDGVQGQTTVWDEGEEIDKVTARKPGGTMEVRSCRVCKDRLREKAEENEGASGVGACRHLDVADINLREDQLRETMKQKGQTPADMRAMLENVMTEVQGIEYKPLRDAKLAKWRKVRAMVDCIDAHP